MLRMKAAESAAQDEAEAGSGAGGGAGAGAGDSGSDAAGNAPSGASVSSATSSGAAGGQEEASDVAKPKGPRQLSASAQAAIDRITKLKSTGARKRSSVALQIRGARGKKRPRTSTAAPGKGDATQGESVQQRWPVHAPGVMADV